MDKVKPNLKKPFSIEAYEAGAEFCNAHGNKYRILATDIKGNYPVLAILTGGEFGLVLLNTDGRRGSIQLFETLPETTYPVAKPTTIEDLFADGDVCYIIRPKGSWVHLWARPCSVNFKRWEQSNYRYSNSPLTKWEDAKPFVGKEESCK